MTFINKKTLAYAIMIITLSAFSLNAAERPGAKRQRTETDSINIGGTCLKMALTGLQTARTCVEKQLQTTLLTMTHLQNAIDILENLEDENDPRRRLFSAIMNNNAIDINTLYNDLGDNADKTLSFAGFTPSVVAALFGKNDALQAILANKGKIDPAFVELIKKITSMLSANIPGRAKQLCVRVTACTAPICARLMPKYFQSTSTQCTRALEYFSTVDSYQTVATTLDNIPLYQQDESILFDLYLMLFDTIKTYDVEQVFKVIEILTKTLQFITPIVTVAGQTMVATSEPLANLLRDLEVLLMTRPQ